MAAKHPPIQVDDIARFHRAGPQFLDHRLIFAVGHETYILAVRLFGDGQAEFLRQLARLRLRQFAQGKAQIFQLLARGGEQEIALIARGLVGAPELRPAWAQLAAHIMARGQAICPQIAGHAQQILELHLLVAPNAGDGRGPRQIGIGEILHHRLAKAALIIEHIMGNAEPIGHAACIMDILPRAARARLVHRRAMIIKLQRDADHLIAIAGQQGRHHRAVDPTRHGCHHARLRWWLGKS